MNNPFFNAMQRRNDPRQMMQTLQNDPFGTLKQAGYNVPQNMNDPRQIIQHLMNSGQITQDRLNQAQQIARRMGMKF